MLLLRRCLASGVVSLCLLVEFILFVDLVCFVFFSALRDNVTVAAAVVDSAAMNSAESGWVTAGLGMIAAALNHPAGMLYYRLVVYVDHPLGLHRGQRVSQVYQWYCQAHLTAAPLREFFAAPTAMVKGVINGILVIINGTLMIINGVLMIINDY